MLVIYYFNKINQYKCTLKYVYGYYDGLYNHMVSVAIYYLMLMYYTK